MQCSPVPPAKRAPTHPFPSSLTRRHMHTHICAFAHMQDADVGPNRGENSAELGYVNGPKSKMLMQEESLALPQPYRAFSRRDNGGGVCQGQGGGLAHSTTIEHNDGGNAADNSGGRLSRKMIHLREDSLPLPQPHRSFTLRQAGGSSLTRGGGHSGGENGTEGAGVIPWDEPTRVSTSLMYPEVQAKAGPSLTYDHPPLRDAQTRPKRAENPVVTIDHRLSHTHTLIGPLAPQDHSSQGFRKSESSARVASGSETPPLSSTMQHRTPSLSPPIISLPH